MKTFQSTKSEIEEKKKFEEELAKGGVVTYFRPHLHERFLNHLGDARRKFRQYPEAKSLVMFFDNLGWFHRQEHSSLIEGLMHLTLDKNSEGKVVDVIAKYSERPFRLKLNKEIGAIGFWMGAEGFNKGFKIFHNLNADPIRRIDPAIFGFEDYEQFGIDSVAERRLSL